MTGIGAQQPSVICEIASAHGGDVDVLKRMLTCADLADADWVKVQVYRFDSLIAESNEDFQDLKQIELSPDDWRVAIRHAGKLRPRLVAEVFDSSSLELMVGEPAVQAFKIPTADLGDTAFVDAVCRQGKPVFVGVGGATFDEVDAVVEQIRSYLGVRLILLHGFQNFPTRLEDSLLARIRLLGARYGCEVGFADHVDAENVEIARTLPAMAVAAGATVIEKHLTLNRAARGFDWYSALNPDEFIEFVRHIRLIATAMGPEGSTELTSAEQVYRNKMKKFAVLGRAVLRGTPVADATVAYKRTSSPGLTRDALGSHGARVFAADLPAGTVLRDDQFR